MIKAIGERGLIVIKYFEGFSSTAYRCPSGYMTIGYGHMIRPHETYLLQEAITANFAIELLYQDIASTVQAVNRLITVPLTAGEADSLISFTYNIGAGALQRSTLRQKLNRQEYDAIPYEIRRWVYSNGKKLAGLVKRREIEARLFMS